MHVNGHQVNYSRLLLSATNLSLLSDEVSAEQTGSNVITNRPVNLQDGGKNLHYSVGGWQSSQSDNQFFQNLHEALDYMGWNTQTDVDLDDPALLGNIANAEYAEIEDGEVFVDGASLTDVQQGRIANCYLLAALGSIAHTNPDLLNQLITDNGDGTYTVHFQGSMGDVTIDDDFPVYAGSQSTVFAETNTGGDNPELWVAIIEKAFAEGSGGYEDTEYGWAHEALVQLTGQSSYSKGDTSDYSPEELQAAIANGQSVTASSLTKDDAKKADLGTGIISNHAYVVTDVRQNEAGEWEVVVYNPWGSDRDTNDGANDGFTVLTLDEFNDNFRQAAVFDEPFADVA